MSETTLRPIGTEFDYIADPLEGDSDQRQQRMRYRVVDHVKVALYAHPNAPTRTAEEIRCIGCEPIDGECTVLLATGERRWEPQ